MMLYGCGEFRRLGLVAAFVGLVNVSLTILLTMKLGIVGPLLGTISAGVIGTVLATHRVTQMVGISPSVWWRHAALPPVAALCPIVPLALGLEFAHVDRPMVLVLVTVIAAAMYAASAFMIAFSREERAKARGFALVWLRQLVAYSRAWRRRFAQ
jgi:hypothetical protein